VARCYKAFHVKHGRELFHVKRFARTPESFGSDALPAPSDPPNFRERDERTIPDSNSFRHSLDEKHLPATERSAVRR